MSIENAILEFPIGTLVTPEVDEATLEVLPSYREATHIVVGHSPIDATGTPHTMLKIFPLNVEQLKGLPSYLDPERAIKRSSH